MTASQDEPAAVYDEPAAVYTVVDRVAYLRMNRPRVLNAINRALHDAIMDGLQQAGDDDDVAAVVLSGNGKAFSAGGDLKESAEGNGIAVPIDIAHAIWDLPKPVIASVHGYCLGHAFEIAAVCDLIVAAQSATFGEVQINHGGSPPILITPHVVGLMHAKEILLLGEIFDADWAFRVGLVNRVVPDDQLDAEVARITTRLSSLDPRALAKNKRLVNATFVEAGLVEGMHIPRTPPPAG
jgi:enoyl-CoA hydratase/carnithine racemase